MGVEIAGKDVRDGAVVRVVKEVIEIGMVIGDVMVEVEKSYVKCVTRNVDRVRGSRREGVDRRDVK